MDIGIVSLQSFKTLSHVDNKFGNDILLALSDLPDRFYDIRNAIETLKYRRIITHEQSEELTQKFSNLHVGNKEKLLIFIFDILKYVTRDKFYYVLDLVELSDLAENIQLYHTGNVKRPIHRATIPCSRQLQTHFYTMKSYIDDNVMKDRNKFLKNISTKLIARLLKPNNENTSTNTANKIAVTTWIRVQHFKRNTFKIRKSLCELSRLWPSGIDPLLRNIVFESKMAVVCAMDGDFPNAEAHMTKAKLLARELHDPLTKCLVCHDSRYVHQILARGGAADKSTVITECEISIRFLESENDGSPFCEHMHRSFLLYMAEYYLKIENDFKIDTNITIPCDDLRVAKNVLFVVKKNMETDTVEKRREMFYNVCMARMHDIECDVPTAVAYLHRAKCLVKEGAFFVNEKANIDTYEKGLLHKQAEDMIEETQTKIIM